MYKVGDKVAFDVFPGNQQILCKVVAYYAISDEYNLVPLDPAQGPTSGLGYFLIKAGRVYDPVVQIAIAYMPTLNELPVPALYQNFCPLIKKCTCGVDTVGAGLHSSWCDKA
jgi:hypothetical protein